MPKYQIITSTCPICGKPAQFDTSKFDDAKGQPYYIKTRRHTVVLVHKECHLNNTYERRLTNGHNKSKEKQ